MKKVDGSNGEKMSQQMDSVEYYLVLEEQQQEQEQLAGAPAASSGSSSLSGLSSLAALAAAVAGAAAAPEFLVKRKSGKRGRRKKTNTVDLQWALQEMEAVDSAAAEAVGVPAEVLPWEAEAATSGTGAGRVVVRMRTACAEGNPVLTPAMAVDMLNAAVAAAATGTKRSRGSSSSSSTSGASSLADGSAAAAAGAAAEGAAEEAEEGDEEAGSGTYALTHIHRSDLRLRPMTVPQPDHLKLRSLLRWACLAVPACCGWLGGLTAGRQLVRRGPAKQCGLASLPAWPALDYLLPLLVFACLPALQDGGPPGCGAAEWQRALVHWPGEPAAAGIKSLSHLPLDWHSN